MIKIDQSSHKMYSNNMLNFQESTTILNAGTKNSGNLLNALRILPKEINEDICWGLCYCEVVGDGIQARQEQYR